MTNMTPKEEQKLRDFYMAASDEQLKAVLKQPNDYRPEVVKIVSEILNSRKSDVAYIAKQEATAKKTEMQQTIQEAITAVEPTNEIVKLLTFDVIGKQPSEQEAKELLEVQLTETPSSEAAKSNKRTDFAMIARLLFGVCIAVAVAVLCVVIRDKHIVLFTTGSTEVILYPWYLLMASIGTVVFLLVLIISRLYSAFGISLQKSPKTLLKRLFYDVYLPINSNEFRPTDNKYAFGQLSKMVPEKLLIAQDSIKTYIETFRTIISREKTAVDAEIKDEYNKSLLTKYKLEHFK